MENISSEKPQLQHLYPFSVWPIFEIPRYLFGNVQPGTPIDYRPDNLLVLRRKVHTLDHGYYERMYPDDPDLRKRKKTEYSWVYGLDRLESDFPSDLHFESTLTTNVIIMVNGWFSKHDHPSPRAFRKKAVYWPLESTLFQSENETAPLEQSTLTDLFQTIHTKHDIDLTSLSNPEISTDCLTVPLKELENLFDETYFNPLKHLGTSSLSYGGRNFTVQEYRAKVLKGLMRVKNKFPGDLKETVNITNYLIDHNHYFPHPFEIERRLAYCIQKIQDQSMHPVEKAARIWFEIVRLHIAPRENKKTGQAIGSMILLSHGYLPPVINDLKEYNDSLFNAMRTPGGVHQFIGFLARKVFEIQQERKLALLRLKQLINPPQPKPSKG